MMLKVTMVLVLKLSLVLDISFGVMSWMSELFLGLNLRITVVKN